MPIIEGVFTSGPNRNGRWYMPAGVKGGRLDTVLPKPITCNIGDTLVVRGSCSISKDGVVTDFNIASVDLIKPQENPMTKSLEPHRDQMGAVLADLDDAAASLELLISDLEKDGLSSFKFKQLRGSLEKIRNRAETLDDNMRDK